MGLFSCFLLYTTLNLSEEWQRGFKTLRFKVPKGMFNGWRQIFFLLSQPLGSKLVRLVSREAFWDLGKEAVFVEMLWGSYLEPRVSIYKGCYNHSTKPTLPPTPSPFAPEISTFFHIASIRMFLFAKLKWLCYLKCIRWNHSQFLNWDTLSSSDETQSRLTSHLCK